MSAAQFALRPTLALQLAIRVDAYASAMRRLAIDTSDLSEVTTESGSLLGMMELARPVSALWSHWGRFVMANAEFALQRLKQRPEPAVEKALREVDAAADALITRALEWALLEQHQFPVDVIVAQAFIEWEAARKVAYGLRMSGSVRTGSGSLRGTASADDPELRDRQCMWEAQSAAFLMRAVSALEGRTQHRS